MSRNFRRDRALIALLILGLLLNLGAWNAARGRTFLVPPASPLPLEIAGWKGTVIPPQDSTRAILPHARINTVRYERAGSPPLDLVVIASRDPNDMHTPERCFTGSGFDLSERGTIPLEVKEPALAVWTMNKMLARSQEQEDQVLYFYDGVPKLGSSTVMARVAMKLRGPSKEPAYFIRLSCPTLGDRQAALHRLTEFATELMKQRAVWQKTE
jgi:hypothetical protein